MGPSGAERDSSSEARQLTVIGDHVDILGRASLNDLILRVAGGKGDLIEETFVSDIRKYADRVKIYEEERFVDSDAIRSANEEHVEQQQQDE